VFNRTTRTAQIQIRLSEAGTTRENIATTKQLKEGYMKLKKSMLAAGVITTVTAGSLLGLGSASADTADGSSLIDKIASKFNLNRDEVEAVFDEEKAERQAERQADFSEELQEKVDAGDITAEQKTAIEAKMTEMQTARETEREAIQQWAEDNNIDMKYVMGGHGRMGNNSSDYLDEAVEDGDITAEQKTLIEEKQDELQNARETARDELEQWAEDNDIDLQDIMPMGGGRGHGGGMGMMGEMH
jgi:polyhydroxyalkanoate synthesis regulator phasin